MKQISHKLIMRNINELIGIINGISYDGIINKLEVARLSSWVKKNRNLSYEHKQAHLISLVEQVLEDGIITDEEREMLLENCSQYTAFETDSIAKVYELNGIIEGIICDNEINEKEVCRLQDWMRTRGLLEIRAVTLVVLRVWDYTLFRKWQLTCLSRWS